MQFPLHFLDLPIGIAKFFDISVCFSALLDILILNKTGLIQASLDRLDGSMYGIDST